MSIITPTLSKEVGWDKRTISYPTLEQVKSCTSHYQLLIWYRFLTSPENKDQEQIITLICERVRDEKPGE